MDRLTFDGNFCDIAMCLELPCPYNGSCTQREVWERLKAYEDTGLSPTGLEHAAEIEEGLNANGYGLERWADLLRADREGRVVVLPCRRGDELWVLGVESVYPTIVTDISTLNGRTVLKTSASGVVSAGDIGKGVFLTREEAEAALRRDDHD